MREPRLYPDQPSSAPPEEPLHRPYPFVPELEGEGVSGRVSVVVVHFRGEDDLRRCIASVLSQEHPDLELVVVDNGASDGAVERCRPSQGPGEVSGCWRPLHLDTNRGFAGGVNAGLSQCSGERILLLNPDAELDLGALAALLKASAEADIVAPRILLRDGRDLLDNCGHGLFPDGLNWCRGRGEPALGRYLEAEPLLLFSGAAVLFRREALVRTGGLDPSYFAYGEDADLALRSARLGLRCHYEPEAVVRHRVGGSFGALSFRKAFLVERNRARVALTHLPVAWLFTAPLWTVARHGVLGLASLRGRGLSEGQPWSTRFALPLGVLLGQLAAWGRVPGSLRRRRALRRWVETTPSRQRDDWSERLRDWRVGLAELSSRPAPIPVVPAPSSGRPAS